MTRIRPCRRQAATLWVLLLWVGVSLASFMSPAPAIAAESLSLAKRFEDLSQNGNSNCSREFMDSIASMPSTLLLKGSCCSPMDRHRYTEQVTGLEQYRDIAAIPDDPYNIPAAKAQKAMSHYEIELTSAEQQAYDHAMANSDEKGPCCCQCWRWKVYGGLAKLLIREHGFTGEQIVKVWNLSDGCGGAGEHEHG
jgi:hypothetical protein